MLGGLAIGIERQWSGHASGPAPHFGGLRTFSLLGLTAGLAGWLLSLGYMAAGSLLLAVAGGLIVAGYVAASRSDVDATTEVSAVVVLAAGAVAGLGFLALASAVVALTALLLVEKSRLHSLVRRLHDRELAAAARFAVMAAVVLPLLPAGPYGPWDTIRPRELWVLVLFFSGLSFAGYLAKRAVGAEQGYPIAGLFGGLISSTSVTLTFARESRASPWIEIPLAYGTIAANTMLFLRVGTATAVLNPALAYTLVPYLLPPFIVGLAGATFGLRAGPGAQAPDDRPSNPLELRAALQMAVLFQIVLIVVAALGRWFGEAGIIASGAILGLTDVDALTISMARNAQTSDIPLALAAQGIATGILANTGLKLALTLVLGSAGFRRRAGVALAAMGLVGAGVLWWW